MRRGTECVLLVGLLTCLVYVLFMGATHAVAAIYGIPVQVGW